MQFFLCVQYNDDRETENERKKIDVSENPQRKWNHCLDLPIITHMQKNMKLKSRDKRQERARGKKISE